MPELEPLEKLIIELTDCRREAISLGDDLLVYLLNMAILHVRKKNSAAAEAAVKPSNATSSSSPRSAAIHYLPDGPTERILLRLFASLSQSGYKVDSGGAKGGIVDFHKGA